MKPHPIGYYGIIIPHYNYYQGFFLYEDSGSSNYLAVLRQAPFSLSETRKPISGVSDKDQGLVGALCATHIEGACTQNQVILLRASAALAVLANSKFFVIRGDIEASGIGSDFWRMPGDISSPEAARDYIHNLPDVRTIQETLTKEALDLIKQKKH